MNTSKNSLTFNLYLFVLILLLSTKTTIGQYCITNLGGSGCLYNNHINDVTFYNTTLANLNSGCVTSVTNSYTDFPATGNKTATLIKGVTYGLHVNTGDYFSRPFAWVDFDQSQTFDSSEYFGFANYYHYSQGWTQLVTIPLNAATGTTKMRIRSRYQFSIGPTNACTYYNSGEIEDYTITIVSGTQCSGVPNKGTVKNSDSNLCPNYFTDFTLSGATMGPGVTYQWQSSPDSLSWTDIPGAIHQTIPSYKFYNTLYFRCNTTCGGITVSSNAKLVPVKNYLTCYCSTGAQNAGDEIGNVKIGTLNNGNPIPSINNTTATHTYSDFTNLPAVNLKQGVLYPISVCQISNYNYQDHGFVSFYIDYNHDGDFDSLTEVYNIGATETIPTSQSIASGYVRIPPDALPGLTRLQIDLSLGITPPHYPCTLHMLGETEAYMVNIQSDSASTAMPIPGIASAKDSTVCSGRKVYLRLNGNSNYSGQTYQWQSSPDSLSWTNIPGAIYPNSVDTNFVASTYYRCQSNCSGNSAISTVVHVKQNPPSRCYCFIQSTYAYYSDIGWFQFGGIAVGGDTTTYANVTAVQLYTDNTNLAPAQVNAGFSYPFRLKAIFNILYQILNILTIYIDYNQSGTYDANEIAYSAYTPTNNTITGFINIPWNALNGLTGLRIIYGDSVGGPCTSNNFGEVEDYLVNINSPSAVAAISSEKNLYVYPNPASESVELFSDYFNKENLTLKLYSINGELMYTENFFDFSGNLNLKIPVKEYARGIYFLQLRSEKTVLTKKISLN